MPIPRRPGVLLDASRLDHELARRGLTARALSERSGCSEFIISRARHGAPVSAQTLRRLGDALNECPVLPGAEAIIALPSHLAADTA
jgi:DNA-binding Xre family transcriptional regulator